MTDTLPKTTDYSNLFKFVDRFISDLRKSIRVINDKINDEYLNIAQTPNANLGAVFADAIHDYNKNKNNSEKRIAAAKTVVYWIDEITARGFVREGTENVPKLHKCQSDLTAIENELAEIGPKFEQLKQEYNELKENHRVLQTEYERLKMQIDKQ